MFRTLRHVALAAVVTFVVFPAGADTPAGSFALTGVRLFDGTTVSEDQTVIVQNGLIQAVGPHLVPPFGMPVIDGTGATLLPGLIDGHSHARARALLERALFWGVTTELDMWNDPDRVAWLRQEEALGMAQDRAELFSAGNPATAPEGYPYVFTPEIETPTLSTPQEAPGFVADRVAEGSDYLKLMLERGGETFLFDAPVLDRRTVRALTRAAHARGLLAVAHVTEQELAVNGIKDGLDALVHIFIDQPASKELLALAKAKGIFVVGTLATEEAFVSTAGSRILMADPRIAPHLLDWEIESLLTDPPPSLMNEVHLANGRESLRRLWAAGVPVLGGTDTMTHGLTMHREVELMVEAGIPPLEVLRAVTSAAADAFGFTDRGRVAPGLRADLLLVAGDPTTDILETRSIVAVWKRGVPVGRP